MIIMSKASFVMLMHKNACDIKILRKNQTKLWAD